MSYETVVIAQMRNVMCLKTGMVPPNNTMEFSSKLHITHSMQNTDLNHTGNKYKDTAYLPRTTKYLMK